MMCVPEVRLRVERHDIADSGKTYATEPFLTRRSSARDRKQMILEDVI